MAEGVTAPEPLPVGVTDVVVVADGVFVGDRDGVCVALDVDVRLAPRVALVDGVDAPLGVTLAVSEPVADSVTAPVPDTLGDGVGVQDALPLLVGELVGVSVGVGVGDVVAATAAPWHWSVVTLNVDGG